jgi:hypothetical protein
VVGRWHNTNFKTDNSVKIGTENQLIKMSYMVGSVVSFYGKAKKKNKVWPAQRLKIFNYPR